MTGNVAIRSRERCEVFRHVFAMLKVVSEPRVLMSICFPIHDVESSSGAGRGPPCCRLRGRWVPVFIATPRSAARQGVFVRRRQIATRWPLAVLRDTWRALLGVACAMKSSTPRLGAMAAAEGVVAGDHHGADAILRRCAKRSFDAPFTSLLDERREDFATSATRAGAAGTEISSTTWLMREFSAS